MCNIIKKEVIIMSYELFQSGPSVYIPAFLLSLAITILVYGCFPLLFAEIRKTPIAKKKFKWLCWGLNIVFGLVIFGVYFTVPYLLWTWIFSTLGTKRLMSRGVLIEPADLVFYCSNCVQTFVGSNSYTSDKPKCPKCKTKTCSTGICKTKWIEMTKEERQNKLSEISQK